MDVARLAEIFDRHNVALVSVTQSFETMTSRGRLTLNVLLSFNRFEGEVTCSVQPPLRSGDKRSHRLESHADEILARIEETPDITLAEIVAHLTEQHDPTVAPSTVWRLLDRHGLSKKWRTPPSSRELTSGSGGWPGSSRSPNWSPNASSSSTKSVRRPN